jgi:hypothetical protein
MLQDMSVDHRRGHIVVPKQVLNGADVGAALQQVGGEGMTKGMRADVLRQTGTADRHLDSLVNDARINMMATGDTRTRVYGDVPGGEDILPAPFFSDIGGFPSQRMGQVDPAPELGPADATS